MKTYMFLRCRNSVSSTKGQFRQLFPFRDEHFDKVSTTIKFDTNFLWWVKTSFPRQSVIRNLKPPRARPSISSRTCRRLFPPNTNVSFAFENGISPPDEFHRKACETTFVQMSHLVRLTPKGRFVINQLPKACLPTDRPSWHLLDPLEMSLNDCKAQRLLFPRYVTSLPQFLINFIINLFLPCREIQVEGTNPLLDV
jgi:hypothetical protein